MPQILLNQIFFFLFFTVLASCCSVGAQAVVVHRLSCPTACGILIPQSGVEYMSPALAGRFLTTGP